MGYLQPSLQHHQKIFWSARTRQGIYEKDVPGGSRVLHWDKETLLILLRLPGVQALTQNGIMQPIRIGVFQTVDMLQSDSVCSLMLKADWLVLGQKKIPNIELWGVL